MAPFLIVNLFKINPEWIGVIIAINSLPLLFTPHIYPHLTKHTNPSKAIITGSSIILIGGIIMLFINLIFSNSLLGLICPMFLSSIGIGIIRPNASAGYMQLIDKKQSGSASALFGLFSFMGPAVFTSITTKIPTTSVLPLAIYIIIIGLLGTLSSRLTQES